MSSCAWRGAWATMQWSTTNGDGQFRGLAGLRRLGSNDGTMSQNETSLSSVRSIADHDLGKKVRVELGLSHAPSSNPKDTTVAVALLKL